ncbi:MAG: hypothetical protein ABSB78_05760 [Bacteroidota bacterium]
MNTKHILLSTVLAIALTLPIFSQHNNDNQTRTYTKAEDIARMIGKPTFDSTADDLNMKVWIVTQEVNRKMMKGKMGQIMRGKKEPSLRHQMMSGTHHFMLFLKDAVSGMEIAECSANLRLESPSMKESTVNLKSIMRHFANGLALEEKGEYLFTVSANVRGVDKTIRFRYRVK